MRELLLMPARDSWGLCSVRREAAAACQLDDVVKEGRSTVVFAALNSTSIAVGCRVSNHALH
jgi:hypothetical protein